MRKVNSVVMREERDVTPSSVIGDGVALVVLVVLVVLTQDQVEYEGPGLTRTPPQRTLHPTSWRPLGSSPDLASSILQFCGLSRRGRRRTG